VLDAGSGTGMLSRMALEAGAVRVVACEEEEELVDISRGLLEDFPQVGCSQSSA
jgi:predicted RNA methylase